MIDCDLTAETTTTFEEVFDLNEDGYDGASLSQLSDGRFQMMRTPSADVKWLGHFLATHEIVAGTRGQAVNWTLNALWAGSCSSGGSVGIAIVKGTQPGGYMVFSGFGLRYTTVGFFIEFLNITSPTSFIHQNLVTCSGSHNAEFNDYTLSITKVIGGGSPVQGVYYVSAQRDGVDIGIAPRFVPSVGDLPFMQGQNLYIILYGECSSGGNFYNKVAKVVFS